MAIVSKPQYFLGTVVAIDKDDNDKLKNDREFHEIIVDIPGVIQGVKAFPEMSELDEPKIGDQVLLLSLDPLYNSYFIYKKLKENDFIGFRASGKMIDITPDAITIGVFEEITDYGNDEHWDGDKISGKQITSVIIDKDGNINIDAAKDRGDGNANIYIKGDTNVEIDGSTDVKIHGQNGSTVTIDKDYNINVTGNCNITANSSCKIDSPNVQITGGTLTVNGSATPPSSGPFCALPACLFTGATHTSNKVVGT